MIVTFTPSRAVGKITVPPSKSMAHRILIAAGLADGESVIDNLLPNEDILATVDCLTALGADVAYDGKKATVRGVGGKIHPRAPLGCRECGSTLRFLIPIAAISKEISHFTGSERLMTRGLSVYEEIFDEQKLPFTLNETSLTLSGPLSGGQYTVKGNISSQFISGLLFALPLTENDSHITILPPIESASYLDLTLDVLKTFGITVERKSETELFIPGKQHYQSQTLAIEGDYSNAAFLAALSLLGDDVTLIGLRRDSLQGDRVYESYFEKLRQGRPTLSLADCPDLGPILMTLAGLFHGGVFTDTARLAIKESDRRVSMATELEKCGIHCRIDDNTVTVDPAALHAPEAALSGHNDHRVVMALSILLTRLGGSLEGAEAVKKSYPDFFSDLLSLGITLTKEG